MNATHAALPTRQALMKDALARCARRCMDASDGRTEAGAVREARNALVAAGLEQQGAEALAQAVRRVGVAVGRVAAGAGRA